MRRQSTPTRFVLALAAGLTLSALPGATAAAEKKTAPPPQRLLTFDTCVNVIEGDLIEAKQVGLIRLIGVIAPTQGEPGYKEAIVATKRLAMGKQIKVEICPERPNDYRKRLRAVVYLPDGTNLNTKLLRQGVVKTLAHNPCHVDVSNWKSYQESARQAKLGLWAPAEKKPAAGASVRIRRSR